MSGSLTIATLFPLATVAAGDEANGPALARRARDRGLSAEAVTVDRPDSFVEADIYLLGGTGRDGVGQLISLLSDTEVVARVSTGLSLLFAVDAGLDALSLTWVDAAGHRQDGLGLVPLVVSGAAPVTGAVVTRPNAELGLPALVGWESNDVRTQRAAAAPFCVLEHGLGDRADTRTDGVVSGSVIGTRLHGPLIALNPELADVLLARATGRTEPWPELRVPAVEEARANRIAEVRAEAAAVRDGWAARLHRAVRPPSPVRGDR